MKGLYENIVIEVSLDPVHSARLRDLTNSPILDSAKKVHFVNIFNESQAKFLPLSIDKKNCDEVEDYILDVLANVRDTLLPIGRKEEDFKLHSLFAKDYKVKSKQFLSDIKADLVITSTRGEQYTSGLFTDSLSYYLVSHSPCDVYVLTDGGHGKLDSYAI